MLFCAAASLVVASFPAQAADGSADLGISDLTQNATIWSPELAGGQWGWRLTKYKYIGAAYKFNGETIFFLQDKITGNSGSLLWDPLKGTGIYLNPGETKKFWSYHVNDRSAILNGILGLLFLTITV